MGRTSKKKRVCNTIEDDIADDLYYFNTLKCTPPKMYNKSPLINSYKSSYHNMYDTDEIRQIYKSRQHNETHGTHGTHGTHENSQKYTVPKMQNIMKPRNPMQDLYIQNILNQNISIILATGPAGTGKSCIGVSAAIDLFNKNVYERIVITRPAVTVDEEHGFLPGKIEDKLDPWVRPLYDTFYKYYSPDEVKSMIAQKIIDICPLAYLRGRTLENSFIIVDEAQNCSVKQMLMTLTRIGSGSKMIITGDTSQHDRGYEKSGLTDLIERLYKNKNNETDESCSSSGISHIQFTSQHIERHPIIKKILQLYE